MLVFIFCSTTYADFFENSTRRSLSNEELNSLLPLWILDGNPEYNPLCSAFLVQNTLGQIQMMTARHCLSYAEVEFCKDKKFQVTPIHEASIPRFMLWCKRIIAGTLQDDMILFEMNSYSPDSENIKDPLPILKNVRQFSLADYIPPVGTQLNMLGFPSDKEQKSSPTLTENCQIQPKNSTSVKNGEIVFDRKGLTKFLAPLVGKHNCSVYGGNSGGPLFIKDTDIVIGLPISYFPNNYITGSQKKSALFESTKGFIKRNRKVLVENGVILTLPIQ